MLHACVKRPVAKRTVQASRWDVAVETNHIYEEHRAACRRFGCEDCGPGYVRQVNERMLACRLNQTEMAAQDLIDIMEQRLSGTSW